MAGLGVSACLSTKSKARSSEEEEEYFPDAKRMRLDSLPNPTLLTPPPSEYGDASPQIEQHFSETCHEVTNRSPKDGRSLVSSNGDISPTPPKLRDLQVLEQPSLDPCNEPAGTKNELNIVAKSPDPYIVNLDHEEDTDSVLFPAHIREKLFDSQIEGIQFLWREVVQNAGGALLAHTMGMGKTLQVITLLYLISQAGKSRNPNTSKTLPEHLSGTLHILIVAPPGLLQNWKQEFCKWIPERDDEQLLRFFIPSQSKEPDERVEILREWNKLGGVLMLGYQMFRDYALGPRNEELSMSKRRRRPTKAKNAERSRSEMDEADESTDETLDRDPGEEEQKMKKAEELADIVLLKPSIVVADEAHAVKNEESMLSVALHQIGTKSRVALTGSPLANNLKEYYCLTSWVADGLLNTKPRFKSFFMEPIEAGLYEESSFSQRVISLRRLAVRA
ncbi:hypothetical protein ABW20_dc0103441 [Dactylellina cionopaga]|nr:hypothetical protein ABW20_dc0103441 [Dactylellina cionopaga]